MGVLGWLANIVLEPLGWTGLNIWLVSTFAISATHEYFRRITVSQHWLHTAPYSAPPHPLSTCAHAGLTARALRRLRVLDHTGHGRAGHLPLLVRTPARPAAGRRGATAWPDPSLLQELRGALSARGARQALAAATRPAGRQLQQEGDADHGAGPALDLRGQAEPVSAAARVGSARGLTGPSCAWQGGGGEGQISASRRGPASLSARLCVLQPELSRAATQGAESGAHDADIRRLRAMVRPSVLLTRHSQWR